MGSVDGAYKDYQNLSRMLDTNILSRDDVYTELMNKENKVLDTINKVAEAQVIKRSTGSIIYNRPVIDVVATFVNTWKNILHELVIEEGYKHVESVFWEGDRKIYVGFMIVLIAFILFFVEISQ